VKEKLTGSFRKPINEDFFMNFVLHQILVEWGNHVQWDRHGI